MKFSVRRQLLLAFLAAVSSFISPAVSAQVPDDFKTKEYMAQGGLELIRAADAYALGYTGAGVVVAVVDTGIDGIHPEFAGKILEGIDATESPRIISPGESMDGAIPHGSWTAGIIAARRDGVGMHGVAFNADLVPVRLRLNVPGVDSELYDPPAWRYLAARGVPIVNASFGLSIEVTQRTREEVDVRFPNLVSSLRDLAESGALIVFSSGNDAQANPTLLSGLPYLYPELTDNWLAVTAVDMNKDIAFFANRCGVAKDWCLAAPGHSDDGGIYSVRGNTGGYAWGIGTSGAAPHATGAAALVKEAFPYFEAYHLQQTILTTAQDLGDPGVDEVFGWGLLDAGRAVLGPATFVRDFDINTRGYDSTFGNDIDGPGALIKRGAGTLTMSGDNAYQGGTFIHGGSIYMTRFHVGPVLGITLHGDGSPVPLTTEDKADVDGIELKLYLATLPKVGQEFTLIQADGGLEGDFNAPERLGAIRFSPPHIVDNRSVVAVASKQFLDPETDYSANRRAVLGYLNGADVSGGGPLMGALAQEEPGSAMQMVAADLLSGDALAAFPLAVNGVAQGLHRDLRDRNERQGGTRPAVWARGTGLRMRAASDGNGPGFDTYGNGWQLGFERLKGAGMVGVAFAHGSTDLDLRDRAKAWGSVRSTQAAVYGSWGSGVEQSGSAWQWTGAASYGRHRVDSERRITVGAFTSPATARYEAATWALEAEARRRLQRNRLHVEPSLGLRLVTTQQPGFTERGEHGLQVKNSTFTSRRAVLGVRFYTETLRNDAHVRTELRLGYEREFGDAMATLRARLRDAGGAFYSVQSTTPGLDVMTAGLGFQARLGERLVLRTDVDGAWSSRTSVQSIHATVQYRW